MASDLKLEVSADTRAVIKELNKVVRALDNTGKQSEKSFGKLNKQLGATRLALIGFASNQLTNAFNRLASLPSEALSNFIEFESGLVSVAKTANLSEKEVSQLGESIQQISRVVPAGTDELLDIATAAGQLGVRGVANISKFSETIAKLGRVSDIEGDTAATTLTRILNVTGESISTIDSYASSIVALGNNFAATESEIVAITSEVARATAQFGVSAVDAAALGTALRSVGVRSEEAGGVLTKSFIKINDAIQGGGKSLEKLSEITGIAGSELAKQFGDKPIEVFQKFLTGINGAGRGASKLLRDFGIEGIRVSKVLPVLASNSNEFARALSLARGEIGNTNALSEEFDRSLNTTASRLKLLKNEFNVLTQDLVVSVLPALELATEKFGNLFKFINRSDADKTRTELNDVLDQIISLQNNIVKFEKNPALKLFSGFNTEKAREQIKLLEVQSKQLQETLKSQETPVDDESGAEGGGKKNFGNVPTPDEVKERLSLIREIKNADKELDKEIVEQAKIEKQLANEEEFQFLVDNLGRENTLKELSRIQDIEGEKKRQEELVKLKSKAAEQDKARLLDLRKFENLTNKQKVQAQKETLSTIASLSSSSNSTLFAIGKAASLALAGINVAEGVTKALAAFPPPFSFAAAAAVGAAGAIQISQIASSSPPSFQNGGFVGGAPNGVSSGGDNRVINAREGELFLNAEQQASLFEQINSGGAGGGDIIVMIEEREIARAVRNQRETGFAV